MNNIGKPERVTQDRVIKLFVDELGYTYLGDWRARFQQLMDEFMPLWRFQREELNRAPLAHEEWSY